MTTSTHTNRLKQVILSVLSPFFHHFVEGLLNKAIRMLTTTIEQSKTVAELSATFKLPLAKNIGRAYRKAYIKSMQARQKFAPNSLVNWAYNPTEFRVFADRELVYIPISKAACTSISLAIAPSYNIPIDDTDPILIHSAKYWDIQYQTLNEQQNAFYTFSFVRNPFSRLVSCYREKVLWSGPTVIYPRPYFNTYNKQFGIKPNMSFSDFVDCICAIPDHWADRHFKSQYATLNSKGVSVDFVGKTDTITADWQHIAQKFDFSPTLPRTNKSTIHTEGKKSFKDYYTRDIAKKIYEKYASDIVCFNYEDSYKELL